MMVVPLCQCGYFRRGWNTGCIFPMACGFLADGRCTSLGCLQFELNILFDRESKINYSYFSCNWWVYPEYFLPCPFSGMQFIFFREFTFVTFMCENVLFFFKNNYTLWSRCAFFLLQCCIISWIEEENGFLKVVETPSYPECTSHFIWLCF